MKGDTKTVQRNIHRLFAIRTRFDEAASAEKLQLMKAVANSKVRTGRAVESLHRTLCLIRAFPDSLPHYNVANEQLRSFENRLDILSIAEREKLWDSGISGTPVHYRFSFEVAAWMAQRFPGAVTFDWSEIGDKSRLDELLDPLLLPCEADFFDSGEIDGQEWLELASSGGSGNDFDWLLGQLHSSCPTSHWSSLFNAADLSLVWSLQNSKLSKSGNAVPVRNIATHEHGMRKRPLFVRKEIAAPLSSLELLSASAGARLIDAAMGSLAVRHRETYHFNHANPKEVYLADVGKGISIAVFGLQHEFRFSMECTMGFLILSNGSPIGYGGSSVVFSQVNTGINIFDEYRGCEAAYLWVQVMRVYHQLTGCKRFIIDSYQFGNDNSEALESGAFWFYYRLGYRPIEASVRKLAQKELARIRREKKYRSNIEKLRRLASCDMHFILAGVRNTELFDERHLEMSSLLATRVLAAAGGSTRAESSARVARHTAQILGISNLQKLTRKRRLAFGRLAPLVLAAQPTSWNKSEKQAMRELICEKGGPREVVYARLLGNHTTFLMALRDRCAVAECQLGK